MRRDAVRVILGRNLTARSSYDKNSAWSTYEPYLKFFPILSVVAFILGFLKVTSYYSSFNVNILNYISASELLFSILPLSTSIVVMFYVPMYAGMLQHNAPWLKSLQTWRIPPVVNPILMVLSTVACVWLGYFIPVHSDLYRRTPYFREAAWFVPVTDLYLTYIRSKSGKSSSIDILIPLVLFGFALYGYGLEDARVIKSIGPDKNYAFKWKDKVIRSDSTLYIIGEVQNYLISYRPKDSTTTVYKRSEIDSLVIKPPR